MRKQNVILEILVIFAILVLFGGCAHAPSSSVDTKSSAYTVRDVDENTTVVRYNNCGSTSFVVNWNSRTICETGSKKLDCWHSTIENYEDAGK